MTKKSFRPKEVFDPKKVLSPKKVFDPKQFLTQQKVFDLKKAFNPKKVFDPHKILIQRKVFRPKKFLTQKSSRPKKVFDADFCITGMLFAFLSASVVIAATHAHVGLFLNSFRGPGATGGFRYDKII